MCQHSAAVIAEWDTSARLNCKIAEYSLAVLKDKPHFHVSFLMDISPECDCWNHNDAPIVPNLGILASADPRPRLTWHVPTLSPPRPPSRGNNVLSTAHPHEDLCGTDKFTMVHPDTDWRAGIAHAERLGLGTSHYQLIKILTYHS